MPRVQQAIQDQAVPADTFAFDARHKEAQELPGLPHAATRADSAIARRRRGLSDAASAAAALVHREMERRRSGGEAAASTAAAALICHRLQASAAAPD